jgi:uncharacterized protein (TIGR02246 family)
MSQSEIETANRRFVEGISRQDVDAVANLFTVDAILLPLGGGIVSGREAIRQSLRTSFANGLRSFAVTSVQLDLHGDIAIDVGYESIGIARSGAAAATVEAKYMVVWKKIDGQWLVHRDMVGARTGSS